MALVPSSVLVSNSFLSLLVRHLLLEAMPGAPNVASLLLRSTGAQKIQVRLGRGASLCCRGLGKGTAQSPCLLGSDSEPVSSKVPCSVRSFLLLRRIARGLVVDVGSCLRSVWSGHPLRTFQFEPLAKARFGVGTIYQSRILLLNTSDQIHYGRLDRG